MNNIYIFGHKKPDTDSVASAISLSYLKNALGIKATPYVLGDTNNETKFVLKYFDFKEPKYLNDVKLQIKDINYNKKCMINNFNSIYHGYIYMKENDINTLPICDDNNKYIGAIATKEIINYLVDSDKMELHTSYKNLVDVLKGEKVLKYDDDIEGNIIFASFKSTTFIENIKLDNKTILIIGDRHSIIEYAVLCGVKLIIITGNGIVKPEHIELAKKNKVNIIRTKYFSYKTTRLIPLTNYIDSICNNSLKTIKDDDNVSELIELFDKTKRSNFPVINKKNECLGLIKYSDLNQRKRKQVILVDHNEIEQSVDGIEEAEIIEIIDHHKIGSTNTPLPINFRNMTVGSTNTIIFNLYKENNIEIPYDIAGIMLAGIISDTLLFKSPTTTDEDRIVAQKLSSISKINCNNFATKMFEAGSDLSGKTVEEILFGDFKSFNIDNKKICVSQFSTTNANEILKKQDEYINTINNISKLNNYYIFAFFITDIIKEGSYVLFSDNSKEILENSFNINDLTQGTYLKNIISRKKQVIPNIMDVLENKKI